MPLKRKQFTPCVRIPYPGHSIPAAGEKTLAVREEGQGIDRCSMIIDVEQFMARSYITHPGRGPASCGDAPSVRGESHREDTILMSLEREQLAASGGVPHPGCGIHASCGDAPSVRGESHGVDLMGMPLQREQF